MEIRQKSSLLTLSVPGANSIQGCVNSLKIKSEPESWAGFVIGSLIVEEQY